MTIFKWEGVDKKGKTVVGEDEAQDDRDLRRILRGRNIRPLKIRAPSILEMDLGMWLVEHGFAAPFGTDDLVGFTKQLSVMVGAGVPILQALEIIFKQEKNMSMKVAIKRIATNVGGGKSLSDAMQMENGFDKLYCNLIKAGEAGGVLDTILNKLANYLEKQQRTKSQVKSALSYPIIIAVVGTIVIFLMLTFVVPQFVGMLKESGQEVPFITQMVIDISKFLGDWWFVILGAGIVAIVVTLKWIKSDTGKPIWDVFVMNMPLFGNLVIKSNLSSMTRTLGTMITSGVSLIDALEICSRVTDNTSIAKDISTMKKSVEEGKTLVESLSKLSYFPDMVSQMVRVGEQTGNLDQMLERIADIFEKETDGAISAMTKMLEPLILLVLGAVVAGILIAMYLPIFMAAGGGGG
ncbi:MAG: type II secretion system F family protein [Oligoflexia bacterium]|nr:type II secretion system F family protein [Oligoflexia bacterium]